MKIQCRCDDEETIPYCDGKCSLNNQCGEAYAVIDNRLEAYLLELKEKYKVAKSKYQILKPRIEAVTLTVSTFCEEKEIGIESISVNSDKKDYNNCIVFIYFNRDVTREMLEDTKVIIKRLQDMNNNANGISEIFINDLTISVYIGEKYASNLDT